MGSYPIAFSTSFQGARTKSFCHILCSSTINRASRRRRLGVLQSTDVRTPISPIQTNTWQLLPSLTQVLHSPPSEEFRTSRVYHAFTHSCKTYPQTLGNAILSTWTGEGEIVRVHCSFFKEKNRSQLPWNLGSTLILLCRCPSLWHVHTGSLASRKSKPPKGLTWSQGQGKNPPNPWNPW